MSRFRRIESLFEECLAVPEAGRKALLDERCPDDPTLVAEVLRLIELDASSNTQALPPIVAGLESSLSETPEHPGTPGILGPYRLGERIGEGGFGDVYAAEQIAPVRRRVAIKILKAGMDTRAVLSRFGAERQALALMDHPNVARVLDAGETASGRPYFVMELVDGESITAYCDGQALSIRERLELFVTVCRAVEHAHQKGVIHRDLKPSNILVSTTDGKPHARVIDFGIAKATTASLGGGTTLQTSPGEFLGTPEYMSPEQALTGGVDIDTRSDVYSLGVVLYRILTGRLPFDSERLRGAGVSEIQRILKDEEPPKPSDSVTRNEAGQALRIGGGTSRSASSARMLRGDLDWIVLKAMAKERSRRYASPQALAEDVERYLRNEPVEAGPMDTAYRLRKLVRRHRGAVVGAALVVAVLLAGIAATTYQAVRAGRAEARASREARAASAVNSFLTRMMAAANPEENPRGLDVTVRDVVDQAAAELDRAGITDPDTEMGIRRALGTTYVGLGRYDEADRHFRRAHAIAATIGGNPRESMELEIMLAETDASRGRYREAEERLESLVPLIPTGDDPLRARLLLALGGSLGNSSRFEEADSLLQAAVGIRRRNVAAGSEETPQLTLALSELAELRAQRGDLDAAVPLSRESYTLTLASRGRDHHETARAAGYLASHLRQQGNFAAAESLYRESIAIDRKVLGPEHPFVAQTMNNLGILLEEQGRYADAQAIDRESLEMLKTSLGEDHPLVATSMSNLASALQSDGRLDEALPLRIKSLELSRKLRGPDNEEVATSLNNLASLYRLLKRFDEAVPLFQEAHAIFVKVHGPEHPNALIAANNIGKTWYEAGRYVEAEAQLRTACALALKTFPQDHPNASVFKLNHGRALLALKRYGEAEPRLLEAYAGLEKSVGPAHFRSREAAGSLAALYRETGRPDDAEGWSERATAQ